MSGVSALAIRQSEICNPPICDWFELGPSFPYSGSSVLLRSS
jgi:hypothetical protein